MKKNFTPFERGLKDKMEKFEFPYEQGSWTLLQRQMGMAKTGGTVWVFSLVSTILVLSGGAVALYRSQHVPSVAKKASTQEHCAKSSLSITRGASHQNSIGFVAELNNSLEPSTVSLRPSSKFNSLDSGSMDPNQYIVSTSDVEVIDANSNTIVSSNTGATASSPNPSIKADNVIAFQCNVRRACQGEEVEFQTTNGPKTGSYLWNFGDGHFSDEVNPKHKFSKAGKYDVSLSITSDNGQINTTVVNDMIMIEAAPDADFVWQFINSDPNSPEVRIVNRSEGGNSYEWSNGNQSVVDATGTVFKLKQSGRQMIALNAKNEAGCSDGSVKHISINTDFTLDAPQSWSFAKGAFMPAGLKKNKVDFTMTLIDSSGNKVFETSSRVKGWDGKLPGGSSAKAGDVYSYIVIITNDLTQEQKYFNGILTVSP
jgi:PKD repeat protein